jgi:hypothetical protein
VSLSHADSSSLHGRTLCSRIFTTALLALSSQRVAAFSPVQNVDFAACYDYLVALNASSLNDPAIYHLWDSNHTFYQDPRQLVLTLPGCEHVCGDGWQLWPILYVLDHFSLWVLPAVILISHFLFPPLPWRNYVFVIFHAIGDPIDSLWSMLARQEAQRRLYRAARKLNIPGLIDPNDHKYIATVWSAYEEVGWQDASSDLNKSPASGNWRAPNREEMYHIMLASHELSSNRLESQLTTWVAILALVSALATAYVRTVEQNTRIDNQTAHTIAVVALLFIFIPLVKISGNIGSFKSTSTAVAAIEKLRRNLQGCISETETDTASPQSELQLFPPLNLQPEDHEMGELHPGGRPRQRNIEIWPGLAMWTGMNSSWRPCKKGRATEQASGRSQYLPLLCAFIFVLMGSSAPAIFLSATNRADRQIVGFGCRSATWTLVSVLWLVSFGIDYILRWRFREKDLWVRTIFKDSLFALIVIGLVLIVQIGLYNSCWCRSNIISLGVNANVNLNPFSDSEWRRAKIQWSVIPAGGLAIICFFLWVVELRSGSARRLLCKSETELQKNLVELENLRERLWPCDQRRDGRGGDGNVNASGAFSDSAPSETPGSLVVSRALTPDPARKPSLEGGGSL